MTSRILSFVLRQMAETERYFYSALNFKSKEFLPAEKWRKMVENRGRDGVSFSNTRYLAALKVPSREKFRQPVYIPSARRCVRFAVTLYLYAKHRRS